MKEQMKISFVLLKIPGAQCVLYSAILQLKGCFHYWFLFLVGCIFPLDCILLLFSSQMGMSLKKRRKYIALFSCLDNSNII